MELKKSKSQKNPVTKTILTFSIGFLFGIAVTLVSVSSLQIYRVLGNNLKPVDYVVARTFRGDLTSMHED